MRSVDIQVPWAANELWNADKVKTILSNERYAGRLPRNDGAVFDGSFPAIIDRAMWDECVRLRMSRPFKGPTNRKRRVYPLTGLLRCGRCGGTVSGWNRKHPERRIQRRYIYYTCYGRRVHAGCDQPFFSEHQLETEVLAVLSAMATPDGLAEAVEVAISKYASQQRKVSRAGRRKMIDQQLGRIDELYEVGRYTREVYERKRADLLIERDSLDVVPVSASLTIQRQRIQSVVGGQRLLGIESLFRVTTERSRSSWSR